MQAPTTRHSSTHPMSNTHTRCLHQRTRPEVSIQIVLKTRTHTHPSSLHTDDVTDSRETPDQNGVARHTMHGCMGVGAGAAVEQHNRHPPPSPSIHSSSRGAAITCSFSICSVIRARARGPKETNTLAQCRVLFGCNASGRTGGPTTHREPSASGHTQTYM